MRSATVLMPGTCGELVQGSIEGSVFSVSCPIDLYSRVTVELGNWSGAHWALPACSPKAEAALRLALRAFGQDQASGRIVISSPLPRGKGMGSSTADVAGVIYALALALGTRVTPHRVAELATLIEPSDGSIFPNVVAFDHRTGRQYQDLGPPPPLEVAILDFGGEVDTVEFNRRDWTGQLKQTEPITHEALSLVYRGLRDGRADLIGRGASLSAAANQLILPKARFGAVRDLAREMGAVGVNVGHSGTVIGILIDPRTADVQTAITIARQEFPELAGSVTCRIVGGCYRDIAAAP